MKMEINFCLRMYKTSFPFYNRIGSPIVPYLVGCSTGQVKLGFAASPMSTRYILRSDQFWFAQNQDNVPESSDMPIKDCCFVKLTL